jgi:glycyl-tRNA synthetase beta chain
VTWAALSLADKADTVVGLFAAGENPTGSRDPFGIRRQFHGILKILLDLPELTGLDLPLTFAQILDPARGHFGWVERDSTDWLARGDALRVFTADRLQFALEQRGFSVQEVRAITARFQESKAINSAALSPLDALRRVRALHGLRTSQEFAALASLFKRVKNIARELPDDEFWLAEQRAEPLTGPLGAEVRLRDRLDSVGGELEALVAAGQYDAAFRKAAELRPYVDDFFKDVMVMADDPVLRKSRLRLMKRLRNSILSLADISEIVAEDVKQA